MENKYYWLKLKKDFFKRHDIKIIEAMPNGKDYILFYLKLLCESVDHEGNLRFSDEIPYNEEMLSIITNTNIDVVRSAIKVFSELNMLEILDNGTYYMSEVYKMIGCETEWAKKKREYRDKKKELGQCPQNVLTMSDKSIEIDKEIDKDIDKELKKEDKEKKTRHKFGTYGRVKLTDDEYKRLCDEYNKGYIDRVIQALDEYVESNNNKNKYTNFNLVIRKAIKDHWFNVPEKTLEEEGIFIERL